MCGGGKGYFMMLEGAHYLGSKVSHFSSFMAILRGSVSPSNSTITGAPILGEGGKVQEGRKVEGVNE